MNRICAVMLVLGMATAGIGWGADSKGHRHEPKHGGVLTEIKDVDYELVARAEVIRLYLSDHGKSLDLAGASAKLTLLTGSEKSETTLLPAGDRLEARGAFKIASGTKIVAVVIRPGKAAQTVRFAIK